MTKERLSKLSTLKREVQRTKKRLAEKFGIMSVPTLVVIKNGKVRNKSIGVTGKKAIMDMLD